MGETWIRDEPRQWTAVYLDRSIALSRERDILGQDGVSRGGPGQCHGLRAIQPGARALALVPGEDTTTSMKVVGGTSLLAWFIVLFLGRMLPYLGSAY